MTSPAGPRTVSVAPERLAGWLEGFLGRHGQPSVSVSDDRVALRAPDGAEARIILAWGPLAGTGEPLAELVADACRARVVAALIVRRKAHAAGVFSGERLLSGRHGSHYVQGRTKAGGWSQQRYARRRDNQAERSFGAAAADAAAILLPEAGRLEALVIGGDRAAALDVLGRPGLEGLAALPRRAGVVAVPDPNAQVLAGFGALFRRVSIELNERA